MALADYFDRARQSASQILKGYDGAEFERRLSSRTVTIAFDDNAALTDEGRASLDLTIRLVARLYPRIALQPLGTPSALRLNELARSINPNIDIVRSDDEGDKSSLVVGRTKIKGEAIYIGSDRWIARVGTKGPWGSSDSGNPLGAGAAACLGVANLFRLTFGDLLERGTLDKQAQLSLLNFATGDLAANHGEETCVDVGVLNLAGLGAIGNAAVWALSRWDSAEGTLHLIDPEAVDLGNLQRYVLAHRADVGEIKVELAGSQFVGRSKLTIATHPQSWSDFVREGGTHRFDLVATALDSAADRVEVQGTLPKAIVNGWTQPGDVGVSRHDFLGEDACLACLYLPDRQRRNEDEIVAEELRMPERLLEIRKMLHTGEPVGPAFIELVAQAAGIEPGPLFSFAGLSLRAFRAKAICGEAILPAPDADQTELQVPLAFQSAMAGIMLAAEIVGRRIEPDRRLPTKSVIDLLRPVPGRLNVPVLKADSALARCVCADPDYIAAFRRKYGSVANDVADRSPTRRRRTKPLKG